MTQLEQDPRFKHLSFTMEKFLQSDEGKLMWEFLDDGKPARVITTKGTEMAALSGAHIQGWTDCMAYLKRLSVFVPLPPPPPEVEMLASDKLTSTPN